MTGSVEWESRNAASLRRTLTEHFHHVWQVSWNSFGPGHSGILALTLSRCSCSFPLQTILFHAQHYCADPPITLPPSGLTSHVQYQQLDDFPGQLSARILPSFVKPSSNSPAAFFGDQSTPNTSICYLGSYPIIPALPQAFHPHMYYAIVPYPYTFNQSHDGGTRPPQCRRHLQTQTFSWALLNGTHTLLTFRLSVSVLVVPY